MVDGLARLRHNPIICSNHKNNQVGRLGAACAHCRKCLVTRRIKEGNHSPISFNVISADMLRDAASFAGSHSSTTNEVEQGSFPVIDVPHDGNNRRSGFFYGILVNHLIDKGIRIVELGRKSLMPHFLDDNHRRFLIQNLIDRHHRPHFHQGFDHFSGLHRHLVRQIRHRNGFRHMHFVNHCLGRRLKCVRFFDFCATITALAVLIVAPSSTTRCASRLQTLTLIGTFILPLIFFVGRLFIGYARLRCRFMNGFVFCWLIARRLRSKNFRGFGGACSDSLLFRFAFQACKIRYTLLLLHVFCFLMGS